MNIKRETKYGTRSAELKALPFAPLLPTDKADLLRLRIYVLERCIDDLEFRSDIEAMCKRDVVFFAMLFAWFHETRMTEDQLGMFPGFLDPDQQDILAWWQTWFGKIDFCNEKTRGIGLSYLACTFLLWIWLYDDHQLDLGMLSQNEQSLDKRNKPGSLMGKLDVMFEKLPPWMQTDAAGETVLERAASSQNHKFRHKVNSCTITGYVPKDNKLRSDRLTVLVVDEARFSVPVKDQAMLASVIGAVPCCIIISTHQGRGHYFYRTSQDTISDLVRVSTWWWENRRCRRGLYRVKKGQVELLQTGYTGPMDFGTELDDSGYRFPDGYFDNPKLWETEKHVKGRLRSPWTDKYFFKPGINVVTLLEELYGLTALDDRRLLRQAILDVAASTSRRKAMAVGDVVDGEWVDDMEGPIRLWLNPEARSGMYCVGADPGLSAMGGDYKAVSAFDVRTGEQVLAGRWVQIDPVEFTEKVVSIGKWLSGSRGFGATPIAFESTGVGVAFREQIQRLRYPNVCGPEGKDKLGFPTANQADKEDRLLEFGRAILAGDYVLRDPTTAEELAGFEYDENMVLRYCLTNGHGDNAMAAALAWQGGKTRRLAYRKQFQTRREQELKASEREWGGVVENYSDQWYN